ncbi:AraC-type DNA-binding protein [Pedobacter steynii]|uniref:AraC-type DNA-binding protein n=1 Tax=Pedobacter steynii TaxID=430522 RepID=A0A1G9USN6_9SPHI|nr:AraC family transcriptional regulator [Pedobacter steynii]NQX40863.1 helix-turn-helix transcriptional regulator [Pedobacter steynii]SDM62910.1 AraC-type DNA-binding protein [Pedobacter steynii]
MKYQLIKPEASLSDFVDSFWMLHNSSDKDEPVVIVPDGRVDLFFSQSAASPFRIAIFGLETQAQQTSITADTLIFAISFKPLGIEYILKAQIAGLLNKVRLLPADFWGFSSADLDNFEYFCKKASEKIQEYLPKATDKRKQKLFELIYASNGSLTVKELSEKVCWTARQINRYFNAQYGISLKSYCNILRFRNSIPDIKNGNLFPNEAFADQSHFIKEIRKLTGVSPKVLRQNKNDRFIQFSRFGEL